MKNILKIFITDMKNIFTNWAAVLVLIVLMIIPSLYSLINIEASWDPYSNTSGIKVAIINEDKGTVLKEKEINLGNELVEKLEENDKLGWVFVDKETAQEGLLLEKYYAVIEIPEDFSENVSTITKKDIKKPKLIYTVNEKINPIAPKMTDAGVKAVNTQLDKNILKTVSGIVFKACNEIGIDIQDNRSYLRNIMDSVYKLDDDMPELEALLDGSIDGTTNVSKLIEKGNEILPEVSDTIDATTEFLNKSQSSLDENQTDLNNDAPKIKDDLVESEKLLDNSSVVLGNIDDNILPETAKKSLLTVSDSLKATKTTVEDAKSKLTNMKRIMNKFSNIDIPKPSIDEYVDKTTSESVGYIEEIGKMQKSLDKQTDALENSQDALKEQIKTVSNVIDRLDTIDGELDKLINRTNEELEKLDKGEKLDAQQNLTDTRKVLEDTHNLVSNILDKYDSEIVPAINNGMDSIREISDNALNLTAQGKNILPDVQKMLDTFKNTSDLSKDQLNKLKEKFPDLKDNVHELAQRLKKIDNKDDIDELLDMIINNWEDQSDFIADSVEIQDNRLFSFPNYGSAVTPFYIVLCLWIGGYMFSILLGTEAHSKEGEEELKSYEVYFGKLLLFLFLAIGQALIASLGAIFILHVFVIHPVMFVLYTIFISVVFVTIIYTAVSLYGYVGIVVGVVLLVIQVAGANGTFPIEVNPSSFQKVFPLLPFTYAISAMRQLMGGIIYSILIRNTIILFGFFVSAIVIGVLFKKHSNNRRRGIVQKLKESSIMSS